MLLEIKLSYYWGCYYWGVTTTTQLHWGCIEESCAFRAW